MKKIIFLISLLLLFAICVFGCTQNADLQEQPEDSTPTEQTTDGSVVESPDQTTEEQMNGEEQAGETQTDSGRYTGQVDSNFIEIMISGVPEENAAKVFMLSPEIKENFDDLGLETGDNVRFDYYVNEYNQNVLIRIEKI